MAQETWHNSKSRLLPKEEIPKFQKTEKVLREKTWQIQPVEGVEGGRDVHSSKQQVFTSTSVTWKSTASSSRWAPKFSPIHGWENAQSYISSDRSSLRYYRGPLDKDKGIKLHLTSNLFTRPDATASQQLPGFAGWSGEGRIQFWPSASSLTVHYRRRCPESGGSAWRHNHGFQNM